MIKSVRDSYNKHFTAERYEHFKKTVSAAYHHEVKFRLCETPVFLDKHMRRMLTDACDDINQVLLRSDFKQLTEGAFREGAFKVPGENEHTTWLVMDFGICRMDDGSLKPQLIELQGFPSLYFFQELLAHSYRKHFDIPPSFTTYFNGLDSSSYMSLLKRTIVGNCEPESVVLLEIEPERQNTSIDFYVAQAELGIKVLCITKLIKEGRKLYYRDDSGGKVEVKRIFNRVIFDELQQRDDLLLQFNFKDDVDVEWIGHPNWFFRISKYTLPLLKGQYVPECHYLSDLQAYPPDLDNYVLKPLFSFAGSGVKLHINKAELDAVENRENYILQRKVHYEPLVETPTGAAKFEVRMLALWERGTPSMKLVNNLVRVSKGEMVGVRYNKDKDWVGASVAFFEQ